jgi:SHS2 domain-containing protein
MADRPRYVFLDHTADAEFQAFGDSLELALVNAALATAALMWDWSTVGRSLARPVSVEGRDLEQLLVRYLEEVIYLFGREGFLLASVDDLRVEEEEGRWRLGAVFRGEISSDKHRLRGEVKAITYNDLRIERNGGVMIQVVVDV